MEIFYLILGLILLVVAITDFIWTTLWPDRGAGLLTKNVTLSIWKLFRSIDGKGSTLLSISGPVILVTTLLTWVVLMWAGWVFIFASETASFSHSDYVDPITWTERIYYTGFLIFTLGIGDYTPLEGRWQIVTVLASASGLIFITLGVTYLLSVLGAVTQKRALAESIQGLGKTGADIVKNSWNGKDYHNIDLLLNNFSSQLTAITSQHNAYPILHFYNADRLSETLSLSVVALDDALTIFRFGVPDHTCPNELLIQEARSSIDSYLTTLREAYIEPADELPPPPNLPAVSEAGLPTLSEDIFMNSLNEIEDRRKNLLGVLNENKLDWPEK